MKYIRTKGNIWERNDVGGLTYGYRPAIIGGWIHTKALNKEDIIKEADTIEELCDEFVLKFYSKTRNRYEYLILESKKAFEHYYFDENDERYKFGAIWTDKGLIYVAKMNEKGELELL